MSVCVSHHLVDVLDSNRRLVRITVGCGGIFGTTHKCGTGCMKLVSAKLELSGDKKLVFTLCLYLPSRLVILNDEGRCWKLRSEGSRH